jgi:hypothetical protein
MTPWRKRLLVLIMLWLPLQGAMAANMSLCIKDKDVNIGLDTPLDTPDASISGTTGMMPCAAEKAITGSDTPDIPRAAQDADISNGHGLTHNVKVIADDLTSTLKCDGTPCQASCTAPIPSAASTTAFGDSSSFAVLFNSRFSLLVLEQLQRPPLA